MGSGTQHGQHLYVQQQSGRENCVMTACDRFGIDEAPQGDLKHRFRARDREGLGLLLEDLKAALDFRPVF